MLFSTSGLVMFYATGFKDLTELNQSYVVYVRCKFSLPSMARRLEKRKPENSVGGAVEGGLYEGEKAVVRLEVWT